MAQSSYDTPSEGEAAQPSSLPRRLAQVGWSFLPLGWIAFGGPQAHIALLHEQFVVRRQWLDERRFAELLGLGQGLPGPTSTQMVVAVGTARAGPLGGLIAFNLFPVPRSRDHDAGGTGSGPIPRPTPVPLGWKGSNRARWPWLRWRHGGWGGPW